MPYVSVLDARSDLTCESTSRTDFRDTRLILRRGSLPSLRLYSLGNLANHSCWFNPDAQTTLYYM